MIRITMLSLIFLVALIPTGIIEKTGTSQSGFKSSGDTGPILPIARSISNLPSFTHAQTEPTWHKLTGPWISECDGTFGAIAVHPANPSVIYIGSSHLTEGCEIYKSIDGGQTWTPIDNGLHQIGLVTKHYPAISSIVIAPSDPGVLYVGTYTDDPILGPQGYVYRSTDGGNTWIDASGERSTLGVRQIQNGVLSLAVDPANSNTVFASLAIQGVYKTTNSGSNWTQVMRASATEAKDYYHIVRASASNVVFLAGGQTFGGVPCVPLPGFETLDCSGALPLGPFKSEDSGNNWINIRNFKCQTRRIAVKAMEATHWESAFRRIESGEASLGFLILDFGFRIESGEAGEL